MDDAINQVDIDARKAELTADIAAIRQAVNDQLTNGAEYSLADRRWKGVSIVELRRMEREKRNALNVMNSRFNVALGNVNVCH